MQDDDKDVKNTEEIHHVDDSVEDEDKEDDESSEDESDTEDKDDDSESDEEKETPTDPSTDKKPDSKEEDDESSDEEDDKSDKGEEHLKDGIVETPRENALRLEVERLRGKDREKRSDDLFAGSKDRQPVKKQELSEDKKERLKKYDPKELENLREVLDVMADDLGFVKKDEYQKSSYEKQAKDILNDFLEDHSEYSPEKDKDDVLWNRFQSEYKLYRTPEDPRDLKKLFKKIHNDIVGIKPASDLRKIEAKEEKIKSASHSASHSASKGKSNKRQTEEVVDRSNSTVDKDLARQGLKGFSEEEIDDLLS